MEEFKNITPKGSWKIIGNWKRIGTKGDLKKISYNFHIVGNKIQHAIDSGCYIEAISLRLILIDIALRFFVSYKGEKFLNKKNKDLQFGSIVRLAKKHGFEPTLIKQIEDFNKKRVEAIHNFVYYGTDYNSLLLFIIETDNLASNSWNYTEHIIK